MGVKFSKPPDRIEDEKFRQEQDADRLAATLVATGLPPDHPFANQSFVDPSKQIDQRSIAQKIADKRTLEEGLQQQALKDAKARMSGGFRGMQGPIRFRESSEILPTVKNDLTAVVRVPFEWFDHHLGTPVASTVRYWGGRVLPDPVGDLLNPMYDGANWAAMKIHNGVLKPSTREATAALMAPLQIIENVVMLPTTIEWNENDPNYEASQAALQEQLFGILKNTDLYTYFKQRLNASPEFRNQVGGQGFFMAGTVIGERNELEEYLRPKIYGQTATVGRGLTTPVIAVGLVEPGDDLHSFISGTLDGGFQIIADPVNWVGGAPFRGAKVVAELPTAPASAIQLQRLRKAGIAISPELVDDAAKAAQALEKAVELSDEAIEILTPRPGVAYSGDRHSPETIIETFVRLDDPTHSRNHSNLFGAGLYVSDSPILAATYTKGAGEAETVVVGAEEFRVPQIPDPSQARVYRFEFADDINLIDAATPLSEDLFDPLSVDALLNDLPLTQNDRRQVLDELRAAEGIVVDNETDQDIFRFANLDFGAPITREQLIGQDFNSARHIVERYLENVNGKWAVDESRTLFKYAKDNNFISEVAPLIGTEVEATRIVQQLASAAMERQPRIIAGPVTSTVEAGGAVFDFRLGIEGVVSEAERGVASYASAITDYDELVGGLTGTANPQVFRSFELRYVGQTADDVPRFEIVIGQYPMDFRPQANTGNPEPMVAMRVRRNKLGNLIDVHDDATNEFLQSEKYRQLGVERNAEFLATAHRVLQEELQKIYGLPQNVGAPKILNGSAGSVVFRLLDDSDRTRAGAALQKIFDNLFVAADGTADNYGLVTITDATREFAKRAANGFRTPIEEGGAIGARIELPREPIVLAKFDTTKLADVTISLNPDGYFDYSSTVRAIGPRPDMQIFNDWALSRGVDGVRYDGGLIVGGFGEHNAYAIFNPEKLRTTAAATGEKIAVSEFRARVGQVEELQDYALALAEARNFADAAGLISFAQRGLNPTQWDAFKLRGYWRNLAEALAFENNPARIWREILKKRSPRLAVATAEATTADAVTALWDEAVQSVDPLDHVRQLPGWSGNWVSEAGFRIKNKVTRYTNVFASLPRRPFIALDDLAEGARHIDDTMEILRVPMPLRDELLNKYLRIVAKTDANEQKAQLFEFASEFEKRVIKDRLQQLVDRNVGILGSLSGTRRGQVIEEFADRVARWRRQYIDPAKVWVMDDLGQNVPLWYLDGNGKGPALATQLFDSQIWLVDVDDLVELEKLFNRWAPIRENINKVPAIRGLKIGKDRLIDAYAGFQSNFFKPAVLLAMKYVMRVVPDEMMRTTMSGQFRGPFSYLAEIISGRMNVDSLGRVLPRANEASELASRVQQYDQLVSFIDEARNAGDLELVDDLTEELAGFGDIDAVRSRLNQVEELLEQDVISARDVMIGVKPGLAGETIMRDNMPGYFRTKIQKIVKRDENPAEWRRATANHIAELSLNRDTRAVAEALYLGTDLDDVAAELYSGTLRPWFARLYENTANKIAGYDWDTLAEAKRRVDLLKNMVVRATGGNRSALKIIVDGNVTDLEGNVLRLGRMTSVGPEADAALRRYLADPGKGAGVAFYDDVNAPQFAAFYPNVYVGDATHENALRTLFSQFMQHTYGVASDKMARVPLFNVTRWNLVADMLPMLDPDEVNTVRSFLETANLPSWLTKKMQYRLDGGVSGSAKFADIEQLAAYYAVEETSNLLFDASKRSLFGRQHRFLFPFFDAFRETAATTMKLAVNPVNQHKMDKFIRGAESMSIGGPGNSQLAGMSDLDGDGKNEGILFTDPTTGQKVVHVPLFGALARQMSGVPFDFTIKTSSLSMQSTVLPGIGPVAALAADVVLPRTQDYEVLARLLMPYGPPSERSLVDFLVPVWASRFAGGAATYADALDRMDAYLFDPRNNQQFQFMQLRAMQALAGRKTYAPGVEGVQDLMEDAEKSAAALWFIRGIGGFFLPAAPTSQFYAAKDSKLTPLGLVLDDIRRTEQVFMQQGRSFGDAHQAIVNRYGDFVIPYLASLSKSSVPGSEPSRTFETFRNDNAGLFEDYSMVAGLFAPKTNQMDEEVYQLQRRMGERTYLSPAEFVAQVQKLMGGILYRREEANLPAAIRNTPGGRAILGLKADEIQEAYPSWNPGLYALERNGEIETMVDEVLRASRDPRVQGLDVYRPLMEYLGVRQAFIDRINQKPGYQGPDAWRTARAGTLEREALFFEGERIARANPAFLNLWDNLFSREFDTLDIRELVRMDQGVVGAGER